jgi:pimeloyl-ACP methyl ester carboxylesterase
MSRQQVIDRGEGVPLVLVPGIQGRWEYMRPALDALARSFRVITFPLSGERGSGRPFAPEKGLDDFVDQIDAALDDRGLDRAIIGGVSFGGLIALRYASLRRNRTSALILVSTPGPAFHPTRRHRLYAKVPRILGTAFLAEIPFRVGQELSQTFSEARVRRRFGWGQIKTALSAPFSFARMAERSKLIESAGRASDATRVSAPTLIITGEPALDRVVPVRGTAEYAHLIPGAKTAQIPRTGHLGYITRPEVFAGIVREFVGKIEGLGHAA